MGTVFVDLVDVFKAFAPLNGSFYGQERLNNIAWRARKHLAANRTTEQLRDGVGDIKTVIAMQADSWEEERERDALRKIDDLRSMIIEVDRQATYGEKFYAPDEYFEYRNLFAPNDGRLEFIGDIESIGFAPVEDIYTELELFSAGFDIDDDEWREMKGGTEQEYYALFALWKLEEAKRLMSTKMSFLARTDSGDSEMVTTNIPKGSEHHLWRTSAAKDAAIEAMDAVCYAEHLHQMHLHRNAVEKKVKTAISDRARKAASQNKKHQEVKQLKSELAEWYLSNHDEYKSLSNEKVAELGLKIVPLPYRTIRDAIAAIRKTLQSAS